MDIDEKKAYHQKYNKAYYLKRKFAKHTEGNIFFRKTATPSFVMTLKPCCSMENSLRIRVRTPGLHVDVSAVLQQQLRHLQKILCRSQM